MSTRTRILENAVGVTKGPSAIALSIHSTDKFIAQNCVGYNISPTGGTSATGIQIGALRDRTGSSYVDNNNITLANSSGLSVVGNGILCSSANINGCVGYASSRSSRPKTYGFIVEGQSKLNNCSSSTGINTNVCPILLRKIWLDNAVSNFIQIENSSFISESPTRPIEISSGGQLPVIGSYVLSFKRSSFIVSGATSLAGSTILIGGENGNLGVTTLDISECIVEGWGGIEIGTVDKPRLYGNDITVGSSNNFGVTSSLVKTFPFASNVIHGGTSTGGGFQSTSITNQITSTKDSYENLTFFDETATVNIYYRTSVGALPGDTPSLESVVNRRINNSSVVNTFISAGQGPGSYALAESFTANIGDVIYYKGDNFYSWNTGNLGFYAGGFGFSSEVVTGSTLNLYLNFATTRSGSNVFFVASL